jgi:hypothetical protein
MIQDRDRAGAVGLLSAARRIPYIGNTSGIGGTSGTSPEWAVHPPSIGITAAPVIESASLEHRNFANPAICSTVTNRFWTATRGEHAASPAPP